MSEPELLQISAHDGIAKGRSRSHYRHGIKSGRLPFKGGRYIEMCGNQLRRSLEDELLDQGRTIGPSEALTVAAVIGWYLHASKCKKWLRDTYDEMTVDQRLVFSREEARAMGEASRTVKLLGIERGPDGKDPWERLVFDGTPSDNGDTDQDGTEATPDAVSQAVGDPPDTKAKGEKDVADAAPEAQEGGGSNGA